jgi:hypothetical protein
VSLKPSPKRKLRLPPKPGDLKPSGPRDLKRMGYVLVSILGLSSRESNFLFEMIESMIVMFQKSGVKHTIAYYSEVLRLIFEYLSGRGMRQHKTWVKVFGSGLPKCIGITNAVYIMNNRDLLVSNHPSVLEQRGFLILRAVISVVAMFRSMSPKHVIKFDSVTSPFTGKGTIVDNDIKGALRSLGLSKLKTHQPKFFWSNKAGVNAQFAFMSIGLDMLGLLASPRVFLSHIVYSIRMGYIPYLIVFVSIGFFCLPFLLLSYPILGPMALGRLSIVKEMRGKARVVGITDYWTQILLKPLHDSIYSFLGTVPNDGTNNQLGPIKNLLKSKPDHIVSVDLTAATDRLPVELQARILSHLGIPGEEWLSILDRIYFYQERPLKYAVGQPMGAYSSFAMLALTNHVIMHVAANSIGLKVDNASYAILGDDVAINGNPLAVPYIRLLTLLGVEVNPIKGFSGSILEFAKNIFTIGGLNLSPIGAKSLLRASREPIYLPTLITDLAKKDFYLILDPVLTMFTNYLGKLFGRKDISMVKWLFCFLGPQSGLWTRPEGYVSNKRHQILFESFLTQFVEGVDRISVQKYFEKLILKKALYSFSAIVSAGESSIRVFGYSRKPYIWSKEKFNNLVGPTPENTAALSTATGSVVLYPVLLWYWLSAISVGLVLSIVSFLLGDAKADPLYLEAFKHPGQYLRMKWDLLKFAEFNPVTAWNTPVGRPLFQGITKRNVNIHRTLLMFQGWFSRVTLAKPIQLLNIRFDKVKPWALEGDSLPAVRTAERCLSSLSPAFGRYFSDLRSEQKRLYLKKSGMKTIKHKRGKPLTKGSVIITD